MFDWFFDLLYNLAVLPCTIIDKIIYMFRGLIGLDSVNIASSGGSGENTGDIMTYLLSQSIVFQIFIAVAFVGFVMVLLFGLLQVVRAIINDEGGKSTPGRVFARCMKSLGIMAILPVVVIGGVFASNTLMRGIDNATSGGSMPTSIGGGIIAISFDASVENMWNINGSYISEKTKVSYTFNNKEKRQKFIDEVIRGGEYELSQIKGCVVIKNLRYMSLMSILSGFVGLFVIGMGAFTIGVRLWNIILMFVTSPANAATIPFDDGGRFKIWREIFIGKVLSCYGMIIATNIFVRLSGVLFNVQIFDSDPLGNMIVQIFMLLSGLLCISSANQLFAQLIGSNSGGAESEQARAIFRNVMGGMALGKTALRVGAKTFKSVPNNAAKMYGGMKAVGGGVRNTALRTVAGATFLTSKMGGKGASMHDKMMTALHGNNYKGSIEERRSKKAQDKEYRKNVGMTGHKARKTEREYGKLFGRQERFESGGYIGQKKKNKK